MLYTLAGIVTAAYVLWAWRSGIRTGVDTATYSGWADLLIANRFNVASYLRENQWITPPVLYLVWIYVLAIVKTAFGPSWLGGVVVLNLVALGAGVYLTLRSVWQITPSRAGLLLTTVLFLTAGDLLLFVPYVLSDLTYWALSTAVVTLGITVLVDERDSRNLRAPILTGTALAAIALVFRPTASPLVALWIVALLARGARAVVIRHAPGLLAVAAVFAFLALAAHSYFLTHQSAWPFGAFPPWLRVLADEYKAGVLIWAPGSALLVAPATDWPGALRLTLEKWLVFWSPWLPLYSAAHTAINLAFFVPVYGLSLVAFANLARLATRQRLAVWLLANFLLLVSAFHAIMQIESDFRYRLPLLPALIMLAAIGFAWLRRALRLA